MPPIKPRPIACTLSGGVGQDDGLCKSEMTVMEHSVAKRSCPACPWPLFGRPSGLESLLTSPPSLLSRWQDMPACIRRHQARCKRLRDSDAFVSIYVDALMLIACRLMCG